MKIKKDTIFNVDKPMVLCLGMVDEIVSYQARTLTKGSLLLPYEESILYKALTEITIEEASPSLNNDWCSMATRLKIENTILREKNPTKKFLMFLYTKYQESNCALIPIPYNRKALANLINVEAQNLSKIIKELEKRYIIEAYKSAIYICNLDSIKHVLVK